MGIQRQVHRPVQFDFPTDFPERLALFKEASGLSWKALARLLGVRPYRIWKWRERSVAPSPAHLFLLLTLELAMLEEQGLTLPPETQPLRGFGRRGQTTWRWTALDDTRRALGRRKLLRWVRRTLTLGLWWR